MNSWTGDVDDSGDDESVVEGFEAKLQDHVDRNATGELSELEFVENIEDVEDESLLTQAYRQLENGSNPEKTKLVENRLKDLGYEPGSEDTEQANLEGDPAPEADIPYELIKLGFCPVCEKDGFEGEKGTKAHFRQAHKERSYTDAKREYIAENREVFLEMDDHDGVYETPPDLPDPEEPEPEEETEAFGWGGDPEPADEAGEPYTDGEDASGAEEPVIESAAEMTDADTEEEEETEQEQDMASSGQYEGPPTPSSAISVQEATELDRRWKILVWGPPGLFKTHFGYTGPEPVAIIDLENKAHDIAKKFTDRDVQIWQPTTWPDVITALDEALEYLDWYYENQDQIGTIVVDGIGFAWEWAQTHYKREAYPMKDEEEVSLSSNFGSSQESDWQHIKGMHNDEFRDRIVNSQYHFIWTTGETEDYSAVFEGDEDGGTPMRPDGERRNKKKADTVIRARKNDEGVKVGDMTKSNRTDHLFVGLDRPTFPKLADAVNAIEDAEASSGEVQKSELEREIGVDAIIRQDPRRYDDS